MTKSAEKLIAIFNSPGAVNLRNELGNKQAELAKPESAGADIGSFNS